MTIFDRGMAMLMRGAMSAAIARSRAKPTVHAWSRKETRARPTTIMPMVTIVAFEKLGSFFSLINAVL